NEYLPAASLTTVTLNAAPSRRAVTTTPSILGSSGELTLPESAGAFACASRRPGAGCQRARSNSTKVAKIQARAFMTPPGNLDRSALFVDAGRKPRGAHAAKLLEQGSRAGLDVDHVRIDVPFGDLQGRVAALADRVQVRAAFDDVA